jgi:hypothetical protein
VVTERGQIKARVYSSIQRLVSAQVTVFLTVSQDLPAYIQTNSGKKYSQDKFIVDFQKYGSGLIMFFGNKAQDKVRIFGYNAQNNG